MLQRIVTFALNQPLFMILLAIMFIVGGFFAFQALPIEAFPDVTDTQVVVITLHPGYAPEEVERQVTIPLEVGLSGVPHAVRMFSHTQFGLSYIILTFDDSANDYFARQQVLERLATVELPAGVAPQLGALSTPVGEIYRYRLKGDGYSPIDLRTIQDWVVWRQLKMIPGVAEVITRGGFIKQYQANLDLARMKSHGITMQQVLAALSRGNVNAGGNYIEQGEQQYLVRGLGLLKTPAEIGDIVVVEHAGTPVRVRDVAETSLSTMPRQGISGQNQDDEIVQGIIGMRKGENPSNVLADIKERVTMLNTSILPKGVRVEPFYDRTWLIDTTLTTVFKNLLEGALLVFIVLYLFLGNLRSAAIVAAIIPLALLSTFIGLRLRGIPANLLSLGALDFGIIVDGAVIVVENVLRRLSQNASAAAPRSIKETVLEATVQVGRPTLFSMLIIIIAQIPIFSLQRHEGRIFAPMAYTVCSALIGSLLFSLTLVPLLCALGLRKNLPKGETWIVRWCERLYRPVLAYTLEHRKKVVAAALILLCASLLLVPRLGSEFLPEMNEGTLWIAVSLSPGVSVSEASRVSGRIRGALRQFPEVKSVTSQGGRPEDGTDPKMINMNEFFVDLKPPAEWTRGITKEQLTAEMEVAVKAVTGIAPSFSQYIRDNVLESISQIKGQIVIKVFGEDMATLRQTAGGVLRAVSGVRGVAYAGIDRLGVVPQVQIEIDRQRAARYGVNASDIQDVIETAVGGKTATEIWEGEKRFRVVTRLREDQRRDVETIKDILVDTPSGLRVPLEDLASISVRDGSVNISRESGVRLVAVSIFIRGRDMGSMVTEMQSRVKTGVALPPGYYVTWGGEFENQQRAMARLAVIIPVTVLLIFLLLFDAFDSVRSALLILFNVPFALIGGICALELTAIPLSVSAAIGFISLFGVAVLNGVVIISHFNQLRESGTGLREAVLEGSITRMRAVLMTALLAMFGLLPMALSRGIGSEVQRPLAVVIIGGLISATLLSLLLLPSLYLLYEGRGAARNSSQASPQ